MATEEKQLHELKVSELRTELEKRGLDKNGNKAVLTQRLEQAIKNEGHDAQAFKFSVQEPRKSLRSSTTQMEEDQQQKDPNAEDSGEKGGENEAEESEEVNSFSDAETTIVQKAPEAMPDIPFNDTINNEDEEDEGEEQDLMIVEGSSSTESVAGSTVPPTLSSESNTSAPEPPKESAETISSTPSITVDTSTVPTAEKQTSEVQPAGEGQKRKAGSTSPNPSKRIKTELAEVVDSSPPKVVPTPPQTSPVESEAAATEKRATSESVENVEPAIPIVDTEEDVVMLEEPSKGGGVQPEEQPAATVTVSKQQQQQKETPVPPQADKERDSSSLWIRNISNTTKAADLKALFSKHGKVLTAKIFTTKNKLSPTCFGFMTMADEATADACVQKLNRFNFKGRVISVEKASRSPLSNLNRKTAAPAPQNQKSTAEGSPDVLVVGGEETESTTPEGGSDAKRKDRPRITVKSSPKDAPGTSSRSKPSSSSARKHISSSATDQSRKGTTSYVTPRHVTSSRHVISSARGRGGYSYRSRGGISSGYADRRFGPTSMARRVTRTSSGGYRVNASTTLVEGRNEPYMPRNGGYHRGYSSSVVDRRQGFGSRAIYERSSIRPPTPPRVYSTSKSASEEKEEMLRLMRRREEEHRKKEEELRLQRERERIKYEREKLEREKLELQQLRLTTQLASAAQFQQQFIQPPVVPQHIPVAGGDSSRRSSGRDGGSSGKKRSPPRSSGSQSTNHHQRSRSSNRQISSSSAGGHGDSRSQRGSSRPHSSKPPADLRRMSPPRGASTSSRDRVRSPPSRRNEFVPPKQPNLADVPGPHHVMNDDYHAAAVKSFLEGSRSTKPAQYGVDDRAKYAPASYAKYDYRSRDGGSSSGGNARDSHRSPPTSYRQPSPRQSGRGPVAESRHRADTDRMYGGSTAGSRGRYSDGSSDRPDFGAASRTDPTYASRIAGVGVSGGSRPAGALTADEMFNPYGARASDQVGGYQRTSTGSDGYRDSSLPTAYQQPQGGGGRSLSEVEAYWNSAGGGTSGGNFRSGGAGSSSRGSFGASGGAGLSETAGWNGANSGGLQAQQGGSWSNSYSGGNTAPQGRYSGGGSSSGYDKHGGGSSSYGNNRRY